MLVDPNSPARQLTKRQQEVLDRLEQGWGRKEIANDIGVSRNAVYQHIERLRRQGALAETYTPSGQPPRTARRRAAPRRAVGAVAPRESALAELRELARAGGTEAPSTRERSRRRSRPATRSGSPTSSGASTPAGETGLPGDLVESALRRLSVCRSGEDAASRHNHSRRHSKESSPQWS